MLACLSADEAWTQFGDLTSTSFLEDMKYEFSKYVNSFHVPTDTALQMGLASSLTVIAGTCPTAFLRITASGPFNQKMELFEGYRRSMGEKRSLQQSPVHIFSREHARELESMLRLGLYLSCDCFLFDMDFEYLVKLSHDGCMDITSSYEGGLARALKALDHLQLQSFDASGTQSWKNDA